MQNLGFTLIELMISMSIVSILAAIGIPAYEDFTIKAQVSEAINLIQGVQTASAEYIYQHGEYPTDNSDIGLSINGPRGHYVTSITIANGVITARFDIGSSANEKIIGGKLTFTPIGVGPGNIKWKCHRDNVILDKYVPSSCR